MRAVASGAEDTRLRADAAQVKNLGHQVMLSLRPGSERHVVPLGLVTHSSRGMGGRPAACRHRVPPSRGRERDLGVDGQRRVPRLGSGGYYWPGAAYVGEVGIDGYLVRPSDTFTSLFGSVLSAVRRLTTRPVILSETAVGPAAGTAAIGRLFAGARASRIGFRLVRRGAARWPLPSGLAARGRPGCSCRVPGSGKEYQLGEQRSATPHPGVPPRCWGRLASPAAARVSSAVSARASIPLLPLSK